MSNLPTFLALEKIIQSVGHGKVDLGFSVRAGSIAGVVVTGTKKLLYNSSKKDQNNNQKAIRDIAERIFKQLESEASSELVFRVKNLGKLIKSVEIESEQTIKGASEKQSA